MSALRTGQATLKDFFHQRTLELTLVILRNINPALGVRLDHALHDLPKYHIGIQARDDTSAASLPSMTAEGHPQRDALLRNKALLRTLNADGIARIVSALTAFGEQLLAQQQLTRDARKVISVLVKEWVRLSEWVLSQHNALFKDCTRYQ
jgi:hypothetical protein